jgi:GNAT superfamily N-acetyltransferase
MAALTRTQALRVRPPVPGEGAAIAVLWRELWDAHQAWGGYPGTRDPAVYARVALRLDEDARLRAGRPFLGSHAHLVAELDGGPAGQVEGWVERNGAGPFAPLVCEVRSLVVGSRARGFGVGRALLDGLAKRVQSLAPGARCILAAEVLEPNPAQTFYSRVGFAPVAWNAWLAPETGASIRGSTSPGHSLAARIAVARDATAIARLEGILADRRREAGDTRFEPPRAIDASLLTAIAGHLASSARDLTDGATLVAVDRAGTVRGSASVVVQTLDPPFLPVRRALVGRFALDPACPAAPLVAPLVALGCSFAESRGAARVELTDLTAPGTELHDAVAAIAARPWSRVVLREAPAASPVPCPEAPRD